MTESLKKFAKELKSFRESKEISLQYIASRTKIDIKFLQAIEDGNFDILPDLYMRAFIKEYAREADFDVVEVMKKYDLARKGTSEEKNIQSVETKEISTETQPQQKEPETKSQPQPEQSTETNSTSPFQNIYRKTPAKLVYYGIFAVIIVFIAVYFIFLSEDTGFKLESTTEELNESTENRFELEPDSTKQFYNPEDDSLKLGLKASARVWIKVLSDNKAVYQDFMTENENLTFKAGKEFRVSVGNAGLISMELNKKQLQVPGNKGELRSYIINADTVKSYILSVPARNEN